jgi:hypothetical protein
MRVYYTTTEAQAETILAAGFTDLDEHAGATGVWLADRQPGANDGSEGEVALGLDVPEADFEHYEREGPGLDYRLALIPAELLNRLGRPTVYHQLFASWSRRELVRAMRQREERGVGGHPSAQDTRNAMQFFDRIG